MSILAIVPPKLGSMTAKQKSLAFFTLVVALVLEIVDITIVNTALPMIQRDFSGGAAQAQWVVAGYSLSFAILLILGGRLGDLYGYRKMFLIGVTGFTLASIACGLAGNPDELIAARIAQGAAGAIMAPQVLALMQILYDPIERIGKLAWFGVIGGLSAIAGPIIGGLLIAADLFGSGWRAVFLINGPIGIAAVIAGLRLLPGHERLVPKGIDAVGTTVFGAALACLLFPLIRGERLEWHLGSALSLAAALLLAWFGWMAMNRRAAAGKPVIFDPKLMANSTFRKGLAVALCFSAANTGFLFIFAYGLQRELGYSPLATGLIHMPFGFGVMFGIGFIGRRFLARFGKFVLIAGAIVMTLSCAAIFGWIYSGGGSLITLGPALIAGGIGMGMLSGPIPPVTTARVDRAFAGAASGILKTVQQVGAAIGVALAGSAYFAFADDGLLAALAVVETLLLACILFSMRLRRDIFAQAGAAH